MNRNAPEQAPEDVAPEAVRVTDEDALDLVRYRVCRDCWRREGQEHLEACPQRPAT